MSALMTLPDPVLVPRLCADTRITKPDEVALLARASTSYWKYEEARRRGESVPELGDVDLAEHATAEAIWDTVLEVNAVLTWPWSAFQRVLGPMLAGDVWVIGAATGDGKSTIIANLLDQLLLTNPTTTRLTLAPLEEPPKRVKLRLACLRLDYDYPSVVRGRWQDLNVPESIARERLREQLLWLTSNPLRTNVRFLPHTTMNLPALLLAMKRAAGWGHRLMIVDHLHHMDHEPSGPDGIRNTMRATKVAAREYDMGVLFTAQIGRPDKRDRLRKFYPPELTDLQGASGIEQVGDGVVLLYRPLMDDVKTPDLNRVLRGAQDFRTVFMPNTIGARCAKHRIDGDQKNVDMTLGFYRGRISDARPAPIAPVARDESDDDIERRAIESEPELPLSPPTPE